MEGKIASDGEIEERFLSSRLSWLHGSETIPGNSADDSGLIAKVVSLRSDSDGKVNLDSFTLSLIDTLGSLYHSVSDTKAGARSRSILMALIMMIIRGLTTIKIQTTVQRNR